MSSTNPFDDHYRDPGRTTSVFPSDIPTLSPSEKGLLHPFSYSSSSAAVAPPPAAPPPPPPPRTDSSSDIDNEDQYHSSGRYTTSFQQQLPQHASARAATPPHNSYAMSSSYSSNSGGSQYGTTTAAQSSRAAPVPTITHYGVSPVASSRRTFQGDISLRPNTGETNDEIGGIGSLRQVASRLRWMTIVSTLLAIIWEGFAFPTRLLVQAWIYPSKVVLGGYLGVFCLLLLGVELNAPLRENFGVLYHPLGRGSLLLLMSGMCFGILAAWWEVLLGIAFFLCGFGYCFTYWKYPEYRRWQDYNENNGIWRDVRRAAERGLVAWAQPQQENTQLSNGWNLETGEHESQALLNHV